MERRVRFNLHGQEFSFYTDASVEEVEQVINMVRSELDEGHRGVHTSVPSNKILVLGCLKIAARYVQLEKEYERFRANQDKSIDKLIDRVSSSINQGNTIK